MRRVEFSKFKSEPDLVDGKLKVYEIEGYSGKFKDASGKTYDLRPMESCPSISNFSRMDKADL